MLAQIRSRESLPMDVNQLEGCALTERFSRSVPRWHVTLAQSATYSVNRSVWQPTGKWGQSLCYNSHKLEHSSVVFETKLSLSGSKCFGSCNLAVFLTFFLSIYWAWWLMRHEFIYRLSFLRKLGKVAMADFKAIERIPNLRCSGSTKWSMFLSTSMKLRRANVSEWETAMAWPSSIPNLCHPAL